MSRAFAEATKASSACAIVWLIYRRCDTDDDAIFIKYDNQVEHDDVKRAVVFEIACFSHQISLLWLEKASHSPYITYYFRNNITWRPETDFDEHNHVALMALVLLTVAWAASYLRHLHFISILRAGLQQITVPHGEYHFLNIHSRDTVIVALPNKWPRCFNCYRCVKYSMNI